MALVTVSRRSTVVADDGVRLHVESWPAAVSDAPLVVGLHGITANRLAFLPLVERLGGEVDFVAYDARGRGRSDKPDDPPRYGHRRHADDAACVVQALGRSAAVVVGQSMGAWDGLLLAAAHPGAVGALVLADGGYFRNLADGVEPADFIEATMGVGWLDRLTTVFPSRDVVFAALRAVPPFRDLWSPRLEAMLAEGLEDLPEGRVRNRCSAVAARFDALDYFIPRDTPYVRQDLGRVRCPVRLIRAERGFDISPDTVDPLMPDDAVEEFRRAVPQLAVETVPDTNHYTLNFGDPGVVAIAEAIREALR